MKQIFRRKNKGYTTIINLKIKLECKNEYQLGLIERGIIEDIKTFCNKRGIKIEWIKT